MKKTLIYIALLFSTVVLAQSHKSYQWQQLLVGADTDYTNGLVSDSDGNLYIAGGFSGTLGEERDAINSYGNSDIYVAHFTKDGKLKWISTAGGLGWDKVTAISIGNTEKLYIAAIIEGEIKIDDNSLSTTNRNILVANVCNKKGEITPITTLPYTGKASAFQIVHSENQLYIAGNFSGELSINDQNIVSQGKTDVFIAKINLETAQTDICAIGGVGDDKLTTLNIYEQQVSIALNYELSFDIAGNTIPNSKYANAVILNLDTDFILQNFKLYSSSNYLKIVALEFDRLGNGYLGINYCDTLYQEDQLLAISSGQQDFYICKIDTLKQNVWQQDFGGRYSDQLSSLQYNDGNLLLNVSFVDSLNLGTHLYTQKQGYSSVLIAMMSEKGQLLWSDQLPGDGICHSQKALIDNTGDLYLSGSQSIINNSSRLRNSSENDADIYLAKYCNCPDYQDIIIGYNYIYLNEVITLKIPFGYDNALWNDSVYSRTIDISSPGVYSVTAIAPNGCFVADTLQVEQALPLSFSIGNDTTLLLGDSLLLEGPQYAMSYQWQDGNSMQNYLAYSFNGQLGDETFWLRATDAWGNSYCDSITLTFVEPEEFNNDIQSESTIKIYPNPIENSINWWVTSEQWTDFKIIISHISGQIMYQNDIKNYSTNTINTINATHYTQGSYVLKIVANDGHSAQTVIIKE